MLGIEESALDEIRRHGLAAYPDECCGILIGTERAGLRVVSSAVAAGNAAAGLTRHLYQIEPLDLVRAWKEARVAGNEVLGFYHSHPDCLAVWSQTDLAEAHWLRCSYVITAIFSGVAEETRSYFLGGASEEEKRFEEEELRVLKTAEEPEESGNSARRAATAAELS